MAFLLEDQSNDYRFRALVILSESELSVEKIRNGPAGIRTCVAGKKEQSPPNWEVLNQAYTL